MLGARLYLFQRLTALLMAPFVIIHLGVMIYAVRGGLDAAEILSRTQGSVWWGAFYGLFVVAVSIHAAIGVRVLVHEYLKLSGAALDMFMWLLGLVLLALGMRAVFAVVA